MFLKDYLKKPDSTNPLVEQDNAVQPTADIGASPIAVTIPPSTERSAEQVRNANPQQDISAAYKGVSIQDRLNKGEDVFSVLLSQKYNEDKQDLERQRKTAFLGDLAKLFGQSIALSKGARQFSPIQSQVPYYNDQLTKLKNWRNSTSMNYSLSQAKNDYDMKRDRQKAEFDFNKQAAIRQLQAKIDEGLVDKRSAANIEQIILKANNDKDLAGLRHRYKLDENEKNNKAAMNRTVYSQTQANERAKERNAKSGTNSNESIVVTDSNGNKSSVTYPKEKRGAVISLYNRMKELSAASPGQYGDKLDDINMQFGEGGDQASKAMTIIQRRLQDFPELTDEFYKLVGNSPSKPSSLLPGGSKSSGLLLP